MDARLAQLLRVQGVHPQQAKYKQAQLLRIYLNALYSTTSSYGIHVPIPEPEEHWYDPVSSLFQSNHEVSISSLNNENREDERDIEILEEASRITDDELNRYKDEADFYAEEHRNALRQGNMRLSEFYRHQAIEAKTRYEQLLQVRQNADDIVKHDKRLFTLTGHNPITEAALEIVDNVTTGLGAGSIAGGTLGSVAGPEGSAIGAAVGSWVGSVLGGAYGIYDYFADGGLSEIDRSAYTEPLSEDRNVNYANSIKTRQSYKDARSKKIQSEQEDLLYWQTKFPVSMRYSQIEQAGTGNYFYYNMPGIVGSSFSDTRDLGQQMTSTIGINKLVQKVGGSKTKWSLRALAFVEALRNGWQQSVNENNAEVSDVATKKAMDDIKKNEALSEEMIQGARAVAMQQYGITPDEANELIDEETAFTMYQSGIGGLDPRKLLNGYDYYKNSRKLGDIGADTQFERDMMATAGGDILEAALMVTPYGRLAGKSKAIGRAIVGAGMGAALGDFGFGVPGTVIGGVAGALASLNRIARRMWKGTMNRVQSIEDKVLPQLLKQIMFDKAVHAGYAFAASSLAEAAEEGVQYINAEEAEKVLSEADDELGLKRWANLFPNDLKKRGQVFKAVLSQFGLTSSPYQNDQEFWSNFKGGLFLGGLMTGATVALNEAHGARRSWNMAKFVQNEILSSAVADRVASLDAILKGAAFAKNGTNGNAEAIIDILERAKQKNKNREGSPYSDEDFDDLIKQATRVISMAESSVMKNRLKDLGYKPGSDEANYAISTYDYFLRQLEEVGREELLASPEIHAALGDPEVLKWLDMMAGPEVVSSDGADEKGGLTIKELDINGNVVERTIDERERFRRIHQASAKLLAVTQLLKDLEQTQTLIDWAKNKGFAFKSTQAKRSITELKHLRDALRDQLSIYTKQKFDETASYDLQIEYLKSQMADYNNSGKKLVDLYRDQTLRQLNKTVYKNILSAIGLGRDAEVSNQEARKESHKMVKMFIDNIQANKDLQEIIDYNIHSNGQHIRPTNQEREAAGNPKITDVGFDEMSAEDVANAIGGQYANGEMTAEEVAQYIEDQINDNIEKRDRAASKLFGGRNARRYGELVDKWMKILDLVFGDNMQQQTKQEEPVYTNPNEEAPVEPTVEQPVEPTPEPTPEPEVTTGEEGEAVSDTSEEATLTGPDTAPVADNPIVTDAAPADGSSTQPDTAPVEENTDMDDAPVDQSEQDILNKDNQKEVIDALHAPTKGNPRMIFPGWYLTDDGKILPSDRMYMANPVEVRKNAGMVERGPDKGRLKSITYKEVAARIRFEIHKFLNIKNTDEQRLLNLRKYVSEQLHTTDVTIVDPIAKALLNNDKFAIKLLVMNANERTWDSYYVNEYYRSALRLILSGNPVQQAKFISNEAFREFAHSAMQYKRIMEERYGWKFVVDATPAIITIDGDQVVGEPDIVAVDKDGNVHLVNVHAMKKDDYDRWGGQPIDMSNSTTIFSIHAERAAYADIQVRALETKPGVQISSCALLPVTVDSWGTEYRVELGKVIPVVPSAQAVSKYRDGEDQLDSLKQLIKTSNEKAVAEAKKLTDAIKQLKEFRKTHRTGGYRFKDKDVFEFIPDADPSSIAEAYVQLDKAQQFIDRALKFYDEHVKNELKQAEEIEKQEGQTANKLDVSKQIEHINSMKDESKDGGVIVDLIGAEEVENNKDLLQKGVLKATLITPKNGNPYVAFTLGYGDKTYKIHLRRPKVYGQKNGNYSQQLFPGYSNKLNAIARLLFEHPEVVVTVDLKRSYISYGEKSPGSKPIPLNGPESILSEKDIDNLGVQQDDGKIVDIGFHDEQSGAILTGQQSADSTIGRAPKGKWWQNQLFLVIKQRHSEDKQQERRISIPIIKSKFNKNVAKFIAQCFRVIAQTNGTVDPENQARFNKANLMLHLFIGQRLMYDKDKQQLPNVVYTIGNGHSVMLNGLTYLLSDDAQFAEFTKELGKCELMPKWDYLNAKFKNLAQGAFSTLYDHFSTSDEDFAISIDGVDSGLRITKKGFLNDTMCQWLVRNGFMSTMYFVQKQNQFSLHNLSVGGKIDADEKEAAKQPAQPVSEQKKAEVEEMTEEQMKAEGWEFADDDEDDEDADYSSPIVTSNTRDYRNISELKGGNDAIKLISTKYKTLAKILRLAAKHAGMPKITFVVHNEQGEEKEINGVKRTLKGRCYSNGDGSYTIAFWQGNPDPIKTLAHEMVHVFTLGTIDKNTEFARAARMFYQVCKDTFSKEELSAYGFKNFKEFVAEFFTNPELMNILKSRAPIDGKVMEQINKIAPDMKPKNAFQSVIAFISKMWQKYVLRQQPNAYTQIYDIMRGLVEDSYISRVTQEADSRDGISIQDIMRDVLGDIKQKISSYKKKGYSQTNHATGQTVHLENCDSAAELRDAVDGIMAAWIKHENISALGKNIDKLKFSTKDVETRLETDPDFAQWWYESMENSSIPLVREIAEVERLTKEELVSEKNPKGYVTYEKEVKRKKIINGKLRTVKRTETFYKIRLTNWDAVTPIIDRFMADMRIETRKKVEYRNADEEMEAREDGRNVWGELLTESMEIDPLDRASREVKWLFSTVPATKKNSLGMDVFMPFRDVFGKVLYYTSRCHTTQDVIDEFARRAETGPDKEMFKYLHDTLEDMRKAIWRPESDVENGFVKMKSKHTKNANGEILDADIESSLIKIMRTLRQQQNDYRWLYSEDKVDKDGEKTKNIDIRTTLYQKGVVMTMGSWADQLGTGQTGVLKYSTTENAYKYTTDRMGLFKKIFSDLFIGKESFIYAYDLAREQNGQDVVVHWEYLGKEGVPFSEITSNDVKTYLHNALVECGVDVRPEVIDEWIGKMMENNPTIANEMDALYLMLSDQSSNFRPANFFARLAADDVITKDTITNAFSSGFIKQLANLQNEYDLRTRKLMTVASHNNQYYIVSESNYVNDIAKILNKQDQNDSYIQMLQEDAFASGSVIAKALSDKERIDITVSTFVGMKTRNVGDQGRDYFEIGLDEDIISKFELLHEGYMISPTQSDKKTYHVLKGIPLVGIMFGKRTNIDCYGTDINFNQVYIRDTKIVDQFIAYFKSERDAVEKAIIAYENEFYKKNPGKKIANYSDKNGMYFSSFNCIPLPNGEPVYLNTVGEGQTPRKHLSVADEQFFKRDIETQRAIMSRILQLRAAEDMRKAEEVGLIKKDENGLYYNVGLDTSTILQMATNIGQQLFGNNKATGAPFELKKHPVGKKNEYGPNSKACISAAIQQYVLDCSIKHMMSMQEYQRLFSGSKSFYKWNNNGTHITDISVDYTKRRGGDISTGGVNITDIDPIAGMEELGTYRVIEIQDLEVESVTLGQKALIEHFEADEISAAAYAILSKDTSPMNIRKKHHANLYDDREYAENIIRERYGIGFLDALKAKAKADAMSYFRTKKDKAAVNVADGATYITDRMCEKMLREEGKWDDKMKYAFEVLRGEHGADVLSKEGQKLYKSILDTILGTQKYTATGFRKSDDGQGGTLMTPYYNKTALFPVFDQIAYGKMRDMLGMMRANGVDMVMTTSAVKVGSQGAVTFDEFISGRNQTDHVYVQEMRFMRKQLNTDPIDREEMNLGTQTIKIALSNLRMDDDYIDPLTGNKVKGRELYKTIMNCYNILTDIGFEQVMRRFCKKDANGNTMFKNNVPVVGYKDDTGEVHVTRILDGDGHVSMPDIDEQALSKFLHEEMMSRDCNSNMLDAVAYDSEHNRLAAPLSAISGSGWIDSILASYINKTIIDTKSPGEAAIQRSVFAMEGDGLKTLNNGEDLKMINEDGSMDAIISIDFFKDVIPNYSSLTFEEAKQWLIDHKLIGKDAKTYTVSYRIPTQAQSSINPLKFVDVLPIVSDTIILPKEFTSLTGSDFDIDKLFLSRLFINPDTVGNPDTMFTFLDNDESVDGKLENMRKAFTNNLLRQYITLLMDAHSYDTKWRPIDKDTELWREVFDDLYESSSTPIQSMSQDTIAYQTEQKNNFVTGKIGIGPFALNNNNHIYTMLYGIKLHPNSRLHDLGADRLDMATLCRSTDIYGNSILSWISGGINAHVDIAKDPFVTKLNINEYTYNITNFLLRAGFGRNALWFLNLPCIKELAKRMNALNGQYLKATNKDIYEAREDVLTAYKQELADAIPQEAKDRVIKVNDQFDAKFKLILGRDLTVNDVLFDRRKVKDAIRKTDKSILEEWTANWSQAEKDLVDPKDIAEAAFNKICDDMVEKAFLDDMVETDKNKSVLYRMVKGNKSKELVKNNEAPLGDAQLYNYIAVTVFESINGKEAKTTSDLTKYTKIDTKKHGSTVAAQIDFLHRYNNFIAKQFSTEPTVTGDVQGMFGLLDDTDLLGFDVRLTLQGEISSQSQQSNLLPGQSSEFTGDDDILNSGYASRSSHYDPYSSFIDNKTKKAINALMCIIRNDSIEGTYGFQIIWERIKSDLGKSSLTDQMLSKLRSAILGALKNIWVHNAAAAHGIDLVTLFRDTENTKSLAHELALLKVKTIRETLPDGRKRIISVRNKFKDNALLNVLFDAHAQDDYLESDKLIEVLDFILVHVPFTDDTSDANQYIAGWKELYDDEITKDFAVKLMFYSLLVSNDAGGNNLFKYVPFEMLQEYGLFDAERNMIEKLGDPSMLLAKIDEGRRDFLAASLDGIIEHVESILASDFDFCPTLKLESIKQSVNQATGGVTKYPHKEYIGFGNLCSFGKVDPTRNNSDADAGRIPYVFIPTDEKGFIGSTFKDRFGHVINRSFIRVLNPIANAENQSKYLIYKRIGEIEVDNKIIPIYQLVNDPMYVLGYNKVYNYGNLMDISSSSAVTNVKSYSESAPITFEQLNNFIQDAVEIISLGKHKSFNDAIRPLVEMDAKIKKIYNDQEFEERLADTHRYLQLYDNYLFIQEYRNANNAGKARIKSNLGIVAESNEFTLEEKNIAVNMLVQIKDWEAYLQSTSPKNKRPNTDDDPKVYRMHSGGAHGSDTEWARIGAKYGMLDDPLHIAHYYYERKTPLGNSPITKLEYDDGINHIEVANQTLRREGIKPYMGVLARNWKLVKEADAIFAIGELKNGYVNGGTGWAVQMAIDEGKPVHVFDLGTKSWYVFDTDRRTFVAEVTPKLTKNFAGIGTRSIDPEIEQKTKGKVKYVGDALRYAALDAMDDVFRKTFGEPKKQEVKSEKTPLQTAIEKAEGFIGEINGSVYLKQGDKFVLKSGTLLLDALKTITDRGHNPGKWSFGDDYDGQISYNIGYESGTNAVMSVTNRDLYDEGWMPSTILVMREDNRIGNPLDLHFKLNIDQFGKDVIFLVSEKDKPLLEYLNSRGYKYEIYDKSSTEDTEVIKTVLDNGKIRLSLPSHTDEKPRLIVLEPQGDNKYYVHIRIWDGEKVPGNISDEDKQRLFDALYNELPEGAEILLPKSGEGYYATRGTIAALQRLARDNRFTPGTKGIVLYLDKDGSIKEYEGTSFIKKPQKNEPIFTKVNDAFAEVLIKHLLNDPMPGYETKEKREFLANLARGVFLWIKRENFKVLITNAPYSDVEAGKTSTVSIFASFATIYYQDVDLLGGKYLNILHELLHIVTKQAIPFDSMGRAIADEKMQLYYDMFKRKVMSDPEWKDIRDVVFNPTLEIFDKASNRAKILAHAYSDAGEFISCCISNVEVQLILESITYDETQKSTLFDEIKRWFGELIDKIFRGNEKLSHSNFIEDVTNFLFDVEYDMEYVHLMLDSGDFEAEAEYIKYINSLRERYDNAIDFGATSSTNSHKQVSVSTTAYTSESVKNPRTAVVFTENMQAEYARRKNTPSSSTLKVNVTEGATGTNQAVVRMSDDTTYNPNAFGLIVKKYQQDNHGRWFYDDKGNFLDTDADFTMFKEANEAMFDRLSSFDGDTIVFPASAAMGKAALPKRFAEWLAQELYERYGLFTVVKPNPKYAGKFGVYIHENTGTINVYSKAGNTNLSNFEPRSYRTLVSKTYPAVDVNHVEHAFLLAKAVFANQHGDISDRELFTILKGMLNASPEECRRIGRSLRMSPATLAEWNKVSSKMLEAQMRRSFNAHPEVAAELLRTGDAKITHNYPNGNPIDERFGPILEKIRSDMRAQEQNQQSCR